MSKKIKIIIFIIILVVVGGGAFYWGMSYGKGQSVAAANTARANFAGFRGGARTTGNGVGMISGSIISSDNQSITLQLPNNGGSKIIFYSGTTQISKMASGAVADLANGTTVSVNGTTNSDGSVTAQSIQIRPTNKP